MATAELRKVEEAYEAISSVYGHSELGSLRDDDSVRSNSLRRAMAGKSETTQELIAEKRAREETTSQRANTKGTQEQAMPPPREFRGPWHVVTAREGPKNRDRAQVISKTPNNESDLPIRIAESRSGLGKDSASGNHYQSCRVTKASPTKQGRTDNDNQRAIGTTSVQWANNSRATRPVTLWTNGSTSPCCRRRQKPGEHR